MPGHLLAFEGLARRLALSCRAVAAVRNRHPVAGAQAAEIMPLHRPGKTLAKADPGYVDALTGDEMGGGDLGADGEHGIFRDAEFGQSRLRLNLGSGEMAALWLRHVFHFGRADTELDRPIAVPIGGSQ